MFSSLGGPVVLPLVLLVGAGGLSAAIRVAGLGGGRDRGGRRAVATGPLARGRWQASLVAAVLCVAAQFVVAITTVLPPAAEIYSARRLAKHFNRLGQLPARLYLAEERIGSLVFYLDPRLRAGLKRDQVVQVRRGPTAVVASRRRSSPCPSSNATGPPAGSISTAIPAKR